MGWHIGGCMTEDADRAAQEHEAQQSPSHPFMGEHGGTLKIEVRSPDTAQVCYESGLKPLN